MTKIAKKQKGFTLVELLIVIAIIAVLAAVIAPVAVGALEKSKNTALVANVKSIQTAELSYFAAEGSLTDDVTDLEMNVKIVPDKDGKFELGGKQFTYASGVLTFGFTPDEKLTKLLTEAGFEDDTATASVFDIKLNPGIEKMK